MLTLQLDQTNSMYSKTYCDDIFMKQGLFYLGEKPIFDRLFSYSCKFLIILNQNRFQMIHIDHLI